MPRIIVPHKPARKSNEDVRPGSGTATCYRAIGGDEQRTRRHRECCNRNRISRQAGHVGSLPVSNQMMWAVLRVAENSRGGGGRKSFSSKAFGLLDPMPSLHPPVKSRRRLAILVWDRYCVGPFCVGPGL